MKPISEQVSKKPWKGWLLFFTTMLIVFILGLLASSITERRAEAIMVNRPSIDLMDYEPRNEIWGKNYPREYQSYIMTKDTTFKSLYNSSDNDDMLKEYPNLVILWAGYGFSKDYNQPRGHAYAITDIHNTLRTGGALSNDKGPMPSTCWTCKSPDVPRLMKQIGAEDFYKGKWNSRGSEIVNPIGCADCHDPKTMNLRISRPALIEAFQRQGRDITQASHQEMRTLVCAQCHVEYYFKGEAKYLTFPWDNGTTPEAIEKYYDNIEFTDWTHKLSRTPMIKAQHPGYEVFSTGVHFDRGVSCADCHMPYKSEGGQKFTDHHIQSPLNNISNSCQVCHREREEKLRQNVFARQSAVMQVRLRLEDILARTHIEAKTAWDAGATTEEMQPVLKAIRSAQWRWDYAAAGHGNSFHSPLELARTIGTGIDKAQEARIYLAQLFTRYNIPQPITMPDISTKEKAQQYIGWDMDKLNNEKQIFLKQVVPQWIKTAASRESKYEVKQL